MAGLVIASRARPTCEILKEMQRACALLLPSTPFSLAQRQGADARDERGHDDGEVQYLI